MAKTLNRIYHDKNKVRVGGRGTALKGFTPKAVADLQKKAEEKGGGQKATGRGSGTKTKHR